MGEYTSEEFRTLANNLENGNRGINLLSVWSGQAVIAALQIAANAMRPGVIETELGSGAIPAKMEFRIELAAAAIRKALTEASDG